MKVHSQTITYDTTVSAPFGESAKDRWSERFREGDPEAGIKLACCYEMTGETSEGLDIIEEVLKFDLDPELRAKALLRKAVLQMDLPGLAWSTIKKAPLDVSAEVRGKIHNQRGRILKELRRFDNAILEYTAAAVYFEEAGAAELMGHAYNNLASVYRLKARFEDAHESVDRAIALWQHYEYLPHALDQKALIYIDQKEYNKAFRLSSQSLVGLEDRHRWRAEFMATRAKAQAGLDRFLDSHLSIESALEVCDYLNDENLRLEILSAQKTACDIIHQHAVKECLALALKLTGGSERQAANKLKINRSALRKSRTAHFPS